MINNDKKAQLYDMASGLVPELLEWWSNYVLDDFGFCGSVSNDNIRDENSDKCLILASRLIWTYSAASRITGNTDFLKKADMLYSYFIETFWDKQHGGAYYTVDCRGVPKEKHKLTYGQVFTIYAFSEYYRVSGNEDALSKALELSVLLDKFALDPVNRGYFENCNEDWSSNPWLKGMNDTPFQEKTMNTSLHVIEAYTSLLRVIETPSVRGRVREMFYIFNNRILNRDIWHFHMFLSRDWIPLSHDISYGHDIEGSWLLREAASVLGENESLYVSESTAVNMARACLEEAFEECGGLRSEYDPVSGKMRSGFSWWEQNETAVGFLNAYEISGDTKFIDASLRSMDFILTHYRDMEKGGYYARLKDNLLPAEGNKASGWICPYHNTRMCLEIMERLETYADTGSKYK